MTEEFNKTIEKSEQVLNYLAHNEFPSLDYLYEYEKIGHLTILKRKRTLEEIAELWEKDRRKRHIDKLTKIFSTIVPPSPPKGTSQSKSGSFFAKLCSMRGMKSIFTKQRRPSPNT